MKIIRALTLGACAFLVGTVAFAAGGPERWQLDKAGLNSMIRITLSQNGGAEKRYDPEYAWVANESDKLVKSALLVYCNPGNTKRMIAVRDRRYITNAVRKVTLKIGDESFVGYAKEATVIFNTTNDYWSFKLTDQLLSALRAGNEVSVEIYTPDISLDVGTFTFKGSSRAIKAALRSC